MDSLISIFHLDGKLFISQLVNFAIVFSVLYFFAFKPLFKIMGERSAKIDKSLKDAREIEDRLAEVELQQAEMIATAKKEATQIMKEADERGKEREAALMTKAKEEVAVMLNKEKNRLAEEKAATLQEIKREVADLVALSVEKLLQQKVTAESDQKLIKDSLK